MLAKAYNQAYAYREFKEAKDYSDLLTALVFHIEQTEANYTRYRVAARKRKFDPKDKQELDLHSVAFQFERQIDVAFENMRDFLPEPSEAAEIQEIYNRRIQGWNDTSANRLEMKIENAKAIILWLQERYPIVLRKSFYFEDDSIYVGNGNYATLPPGSNYTLVAKILFRDIHKVWKEDELLHELAIVKGITPHTKEYERLKSTSLKRICQHINTKVSDALRIKKTKLVSYNGTQQSVAFNLSLFHPIDRTARK